VLALTCWPASSAASSPLPCAEAPFACTTVPVPVDRTTALSGSISLSVARREDSLSPSRDAVLALAGGPGQAALPLAKFISEAMAPALTTRDLVVFDQRGTGRSDPLNCPIFGDLQGLEGVSPTAFGAFVEQCALQIGPARGGFTSEESVEDIEAIRRAYGYEKLVLYGTSYGTKVALEYAERYPQHVEGLVLDSVVPANGPEPFETARFEAIKPVLDELCAQGACAGITSNPLADFARLAAQLRRHELKGFAYDGGGRRHAVSMNELQLFGTLVTGDLNPALRALLPAAVRSALDHEPAPLLRLNLLAEGYIPSLPSGPIDREAERSAKEEQDDALFTATTCEETPFPWQRGASPTTRNTDAIAALAAIPPADFYPFDAETALRAGPVLECESWPNAAPSPQVGGPLPDVPTLILSGEQDMRTPTAYARAVAAEIPDAQLLVVPFTGHSVLGSDLSDCSAQAVNAFFAGRPVQPCTTGPNLFAPTPVTPTRLASVHPPSGLGGRPGQTLVAVLDTLLDLNRQLIAATLQADQELPSGSSFGGLHGGYARLTSSHAILRNFSLVPGVELTATFRVHDHRLLAANIAVSGTAASAGRLRFGENSTHAAGTLGGKRFSVVVANVRLSRLAPGEWPSLSDVARSTSPRPGSSSPRAPSSPRLP
jgi:pimeloyl-ACP methyl ester carboxylesterase